MKELEMHRYLDHAVLKPEMTQKEVREAMQLGIDYKVRTICVRPCDIELAVEMCKGSETEVSCVLAFPHGNAPSEVKAVEARLYIQKGVHEIDMVANYGYIRSGLWEKVTEDIQAVAKVTRAHGVLLKVIFETSQLALQEISLATECAIRAGADYVKTSTGFYGAGASVEAVEAMLIAAKGRIKVKASGGIRDRDQAKIFLDMGVERLGNGYSATPVICSGEQVISDTSEY